MNEQADFLEPPGLSVTVDEVVHLLHAETPREQPHCFAYYISIHNETELPVTIKGRKWVVTNARGEVTAVEGDGVVGQTPTIPPGDSFSYNSFHLFDTRTAVAEGSYIGLDGLGRRVITRIPKFEMEVAGG